MISNGAPSVTIDGPFRGIAEATSRKVQQTVSTLEEKVVATGVSAAKGVERRFLDVERLRSADQDLLIQRLRHDVHEVVDILLDVVHSATDVLAKVTGGILSVNAPSTSGAARLAGKGGIPTLAAAESASPGGSVEVAMSLENSSDQEFEAFNFTVTSLIGDAGEIPADRITFDPPSVNLPPQGSQKVTITVQVPDETSGGDYSGLVHLSNLQQVQAMLRVHVS